MMKLHLRKTAASKSHVVHVAGRGSPQSKASTMTNLRSQMTMKRNLKKIEPPGVDQDSGFAMAKPTNAILEDPPIPFTLMSSKIKQPAAMICRSLTQIYQEQSVVAPSCTVAVQAGLPETLKTSHSRIALFVLLAARHATRVAWLKSGKITSTSTKPTSLLLHLRNQRLLAREKCSNPYPGTTSFA
jgi:hypothetical protein